jgi:hypothetical protein
MTQKELHMREFFEWISNNHSELKKHYCKIVDVDIMDKMPFTMFTIVSYCDYLDIQKITNLKVKEK